jgi:putative endonuclease
VWKHKNKFYGGFTKKYNVTQLVWYESTTDVLAAIHREKQIKNWPRSRKIALIRRMNPTWRDLSQDFD